MELTWGLVVCTYKREDILAHCLRLAAEQTRPPIEVIIVDANPNFEHSRTRIAAEIVASYPAIRWSHLAASRPSLPAQRNYGIQRASADILFLFDDDSLMYRDCAERIMQVYETDSKGVVAGVGALQATTPPNGVRPGVASHSQAQPAHEASGFFKTLEFRLTFAERIFPPYDESGYPAHSLSTEVMQLNVASAHLLNGFRMTFRRKFLAREPFEEALDAYAPSEDFDVSCRVSRHGPLLTAFDAKVFHAQAPGGRLSRRTVAALTTLNIAVLHRLHAQSEEFGKRIVRRFFWERLGIEFLADLGRRRLKFPRFRGALDAVQFRRTILSKSRSELRSWYPSLQREILARALS
jgi:GT2 family glycosyltransferase